MSLFSGEIGTTDLAQLDVCEQDTHHGAQRNDDQAREVSPFR